MKYQLEFSLSVLVTLMIANNTEAAPVAPSIVVRGPNDRVWQRSTEIVGPGGRVTTQVSSYRELASGLHYKTDPADPNSPWIESQEIIELFQNGAVARQGQAQVIFSPNINSAGGAIDWLNVDGKRLRSRIVGLAYFDAASGNSVMIAELKDSVGQLLAPNQVIYPDAFTDLIADARYTYRKNSFEQDIILRQNPPSPLLYGLSPATSRLQVWTEFFDPPAVTKQTRVIRQEENPVVRAAMSEPDFLDESISLGQARIGRGKAFAIESDAVQNAGINIERAVPVGKEWGEADGRTFLVESVEYPFVKALLDTLPPAAANNPQNNPAPQLAARKRKVFPSRSQMVAALGAPSPGPLTVAQPSRLRVGGASAPQPGDETSPTLAGEDARATHSPPKKNGTVQKIQRASHAQLAALNKSKGVVIDYTTMASSLDDYVFRADETYYVTDDVNLTSTTGSNITFEGNCVIKLGTNSQAKLTINGDVKFQTDHYRPLVFSCKDDDFVGQSISGSTGAPWGYYGGIGLYFSAQPTDSPRHVRFSYLRTAIEYGEWDDTIRHSQFLFCSNGVANSYASLTVENALMYRVWKAFPGQSYPVHASHLTLHQCHTLTDGFGMTNTLRLTNSLLVHMTNWGTTSYHTNAVLVGTDSSVFQTVGGAAHYLSATSALRNAGTTNISSTLLADLKKTTTYPPIVFSNATISAQTTFIPQAQRDTDTPDCGFHYNCLDYAFGGSHVLENATFTPGTAVGWFRTSEGWQQAGFGLRIGDQKILTFDGRLETPNYFVRCNTVQEGGTGLWNGGYGPGGIVSWADYGPEDISVSPELRARFTRFSMLVYDNSGYFRDDGGYLIIRATDCEFWGGNVGGYVTSQYFTNCLMDRTYGGQVAGFTDNEVVIRNCTWRGGTYQLDRWWSAPSLMPISFQDCAFDGTVFYEDSTTNNRSYDYNAFITGAQRLTPTGAHDVVVSNFNWQTGALGRFYLPTNSPLVNVGSLTNAALRGLYHYTTATVKETNSRLDIAYHYVALTNGVPFDTDGDGNPDYWEDANGNGSVNSGETDWNSLSDWGLKVLITRPRNGSILP